MENLKVPREHSNQLILMSRSFGRKDASHFLDKWIPIIHQVITYGSVLNWGEIISSNMDIQLNKEKKEHKFYMHSYLLDVMCASREYPSLGWRSGIQTFYPSMFIVRCSGRTNISRIMKGFLMHYFL